MVPKFGRQKPMQSDPKTFQEFQQDSVRILNFQLEKPDKYFRCRLLL